MENVKKEIEWAINNFSDVDLLIQYLEKIAQQQYFLGQQHLMLKYDIKLKQHGK